jgi:serine/threonine protein kinase
MHLREAQTLAALNHPNIAHVHGLEESGGVRALVMELVEGEDFAQRLARGPIPLDEAQPIAKQIADALEATHESIFRPPSHRASRWLLQVRLQKHPVKRLPSVPCAAPRAGRFLCAHGATSSASVI